MDRLTDDFIGACLQKRKKRKKNQSAAVPGIEAEENDSGSSRANLAGDDREIENDVIDP